MVFLEHWLPINPAGSELSTETLQVSMVAFYVRLFVKVLKVLNESFHFIFLKVNTLIISLNSLFISYSKYRKDYF